MIILLIVFGCFVVFCAGIFAGFKMREQHTKIENEDKWQTLIETNNKRRD